MNTNKSERVKLWREIQERDERGDYDTSNYDTLERYIINPLLIFLTGVATITIIDILYHVFGE